ncbi:MAG: hypothetical protein PHX41_09385 [Kiritimatiellae bacterium]|nr:hypothetical protein [Kiritimatiellia bacterium]
MSVATHTAPWPDAPSNAVVHAPWDVYGVAEDTFWLPADGWSFVLGTNGVDGLHVSSSGLVSFGNPLSTPLPSPVPPDASVLAPLHGSLGTVPPQGRFWHAVTPSNSLLCTWQGVCAGRDTNSPVTFQTELFWNGDFTYRYAFTNALALTNFAVGAQHNGGGETYALNDTNMLANGLELRWRAFGMLEPGVSDHDGDGLSTYDEVMLHGTNPSLKDSDGDGLEDAAELAAGTAPLNPDTDGDLAADSIDPAPLTSGDPGEILNCCSNTWLFHVHHALPTNATCGASGFPHDYNLFAVTVTLNAPVADPGAVLWIGGTPLVMRDPGSRTLWLDKTTNQTVRLCAPCGVGVDYTVSSDVPGFFIQPPPPGPPAPPQSHTETLEGTVAVPFFTVEPASVCFHGEPVTFRAAGCAAGLSGQFVWSYGNTTVVTNAPEFTVGPESGGVPPVVSVTFMPDGLEAAAPAPAAAGAGARSTAEGWPVITASACGYCQRHVTTNRHTTWWCDLTGKPTNEERCPAAGRGYIPPVNGTNTFFTLPVPRRPAAWPDGCATLSPWPKGHAGQGTPPPDPGDCGHGSGCTDCMWTVDHWHRKEETFKLFDHCGCCACPEHNPTVDGEALSLEPVVYEGAVGLTAAFRPFDGAPIPLAAGPLPGAGVVAVTGLTPSAAPYDRSARFSRHIPSVPTTFYEVDRFTVLSLDLQPDVDLSGSVDAGDAVALAADWDRTWLIPAGTNAFPLKVFNDVAMPGAYTLAVDGPSNVVARYGGVTVRGGGSNAVAIPPGSTAETVLVQADRPCTATLTLSFQGTGAAAGFECETQVEIAVWEIGLHSVSLDAQGMPLFEGGRPVLGGLIPPEASLSTYVPYDGGGAPNLSATSPRWVTFAAVTNAVTNSATLSMTQEHAEGFKVWEMDFEGATTNGTFAWQWQGASNAFLRAEVPTNAAGAMMPLTLAYIDAGFDGQTNEVQEAYSLYRHDDTNGFWGSTYSITEPRENIGMPAFSAHNAFIVRVPPEAAFAEGTELVCEISAGDGDPVEVPLTQEADGSYVSCLVVPVSELDAGANLGLESSTNAVMLKLDSALGEWQIVKIDIGTVINGTMKKIASGSITSRYAALFSALVTNEQNGQARASMAVVQAGETARRRLGYGVSPLFSPTKEQITEMLPRHRVWVHSGHGHHYHGIEIVKRTGNEYRRSAFKASDITANNLDYDLVFMNTCESTDRKYIPILPITPQACGGWDGPHPYTDGTAVLDIGRKLNAKNYIGWDCEVVRQFSVGIPKMLMQELDSTGTGQTRTVEEAVDEVRRKIRTEYPKRDYWYYEARLNLVDKDNSVFLDLNKKPF